MKDRTREPPVLRYVSGDPTDDRTDVVLLLDYVAPYAPADEVPAKVVVWSKRTGSFLRFGIVDDEPLWDVYGDDYGTVDRALVALRKAPDPRRAYVTVSIPLRSRPASSNQEG